MTGRLRHSPPTSSPSREPSLLPGQDHTAVPEMARRLRLWNLGELWIAMLVLLGGVFLESPMGTDVRLSVWPGWTLPEACWSRRYLGITCPFCGATRSWIALARGNWEQSLEAHPLGWLAILAIFTAAVVAVVRTTRQTPGTWWLREFTYYCWAAVGLVFVFYHCWRSVS